MGAPGIEPATTDVVWSPDWHTFIAALRTTTQRDRTAVRPTVACLVVVQARFERLVGVSAFERVTDLPLEPIDGHRPARVMLPI
jgi:hypothetical protein